jgi:choline dehydrogenase-like flavoprotein
MTELSEPQRATLRALCDTIVPSLDRDPDPHGFWSRRASDLGIDQAVEGVLLELPDPASRDGLIQLLDVLALQHFTELPSQLSREQVLRNMTLGSPAAAQGIGALTAITLFVYYGAPIDPQTGQNPNWATFGYPGPVSPPPQTPKAIEPLVPSEGQVLEADVVVVGSGAGGGVIAGTLAKAGLKVVVLEAAGYFNEADFTQLEVPAYQQMYWRGGPTPTADLNVSLQAGTTLGGGTTINWMNCLRTKDWVREDWATNHGLEGVDGPEYDRHLDAVLDRIGANEDCSDLNGPHQRMKEGAEALGWSTRTIVRNSDPASYSADSAGYLGFGDQSGAKQSTEKTFLRDAAERGADILVHARAIKVIVEGGRAAGVEAVYAGSVPFTVRAPRVVVACGALESPALLLRSGIGGPAAGQYLRLHPAIAVLGQYGEDQRAWWGAPQSFLVDEFVNTGDSYGLLIEGAQYAPAIAGSAVPWTNGATHKELLADFRLGATFIALIRDHGQGQVTVDANGESVPFYSVEDPLDVANLHLSIEKLAQLHHAAGARQIYALAGGLPRWRVGDSLDEFVARAQRVPLRAGGHKIFSAHQMGSCRMGKDPATSVADPWGELHDTPGVWIGDGSAFPTPSGTNPMVSIMALAHRTAEAIAGVRSEATLEVAK